MAMASCLASNAFVRSTLDSDATTVQSSGLARTRAIVVATAKLLKLLSTKQQAAMHFAFEPYANANPVHFKGGMSGDVDMVGEKLGRAVWSNFPVSDVPRPGLRLGDLDQEQDNAAMALLRILLSDLGYAKVMQIIGSDQALANDGTPYAAGRAAYVLAIFGEPSLERPWMFQFGGHHLALNVTISGASGIAAPILTGCLPAIYMEGGKRVRALASENDKAFALLDTFSGAQRVKALIDHDVSHLTLGPGHDGEMPTLKGIKASELSDDQRAMLLNLILEWTAIINDDHAASHLEELWCTLNDTYFAWSGPVTCHVDHNGASYFRIQGPKLFIEFSPQQPGGDLTMHAHTIYRNLANDYGRAFT